MKCTSIVALLVLLSACGGAEFDDRNAEVHLPHVDAPLDTVRVLERTYDTSTLEIASGAEMADPAWTDLELRGLPDPKALTFVRYENPQYGYSIAYPDSLLRPVEPIGEDRGMEFASTRQDVRMLVYAIEAATREDLNAQYRAVLENPDSGVFYRARDENWYIVSGRQGDNVFYEKALSENGVLKTFRIQYPASRKAYYDAVTAIMSASFTTI